MDDYLSEAEQWEQLKAWAREYWPWILGGIALGALGLLGWNLWQGHTNRVATAASVEYEQLRKVFGSPDHAQAMQQLGELERKYPSSPYVDQARLLAARTYVDSGDLEKAAAELTRVMDTTRDAELALLARLRLARVQVSLHKPDDALATLGAVEAGAFDARYHEVRGDAYYAKGDKPRALAEYRSARIGDMAAGGAEQSLLDLKISDLTAEPPPTPAKAAAPGPAASAAK